MPESTVYSEYLPATGTALQQLVLVHGWGSNREIWRPLLSELRADFDVTLLELPGASAFATDSTAPDLDEVLEAMLAASPEHALYVGWSLGAQLAVELSRRAPERVAGLVTLCYNPLYLGAGADWPGLGESEFAAFGERLEQDAAAALKRFDLVQAEGSGEAMRLCRYLRSSRPALQARALRESLEWLRLDQRESLGALTQPRLHLLGCHDSLVCPAIADQLSAGSPVEVLPNASHLLPLESPGLLALRLRDFVADAGLALERAAMSAEPVDKRDVAASFGRCAGSYDSVADLQRQVGRALLARLDRLERQPEAILDLGSGTGFFCPEICERFPHARYLGLDLAEGMARHAREALPAKSWLVGDAEALPLASASVDLVFSSLAIQWCYRPQQLFAELARVLRPGGLCVFTSLGPDTLHELRSAWAAVDDHQHVNRFLEPADLEAAAAAVPGLSLAIDAERVVMRYERVQDLLRELKALGAHNVNQQRPAGLTGRARLRGMLAAYEECREGGLVPASYDVLYGTLERQ